MFIFCTFLFMACATKVFAPGETLNKFPLSFTSYMLNACPFRHSFVIKNDTLSKSKENLWLLNSLFLSWILKFTNDQNPDVAENLS